MADFKELKATAYTPERYALDYVLDENRDWIKSFLKTENFSTLRNIAMDKSSDVIAKGLFLKISNQNHFSYWPEENIIRKDISTVEFCGSNGLIMGLQMRSKGRQVLGVDLTNSNSNFLGIVGFVIKGIRMINIGFSYNSSPGSQGASTSNVYLVSHNDLDKLRDYITQVLSSQKKGYTIYTYDVNQGEVYVDSSAGVTQQWDNLVIDDSTYRLVKKDIDSFLQRRDWFEKNSLPYRRGYLLHGPPGNGKTSTIKAMLSTLEMNAYKIRLFSKGITDKALEHMFRDARKYGPNMIILEDIDRAFPKTGEHLSSIGLHTLLNCLDGLESQEGVVCVATANEPTALDRAILKRPGRFDRVVLFANPDGSSREKYFKLKAPYLENVDSAVDASQGFSFAQLQEMYIMAGQFAYERGDENVRVEDLHFCASELRNSSNNVTTSKDQKAGF